MSSLGSLSLASKRVGPVQSQASPCGTCGGQIGRVSWCSFRFSVLRCQYNCASAPYWHFIDRPPNLSPHTTLHNTVCCEEFIDVLCYLNLQQSVSPKPKFLSEFTASSITWQDYLHSCYGRIFLVRAAKAHRGNGGIDPLIFNVGTRCRKKGLFHAPVVVPPEYAWYQMNTRLPGAHSRCGCSAEEKNLLPMPGIETRTS